MEEKEIQEVKKEAVQADVLNASLTVGDSLTYYTSDNVKQWLPVKELVEFDGKSGFWIEPGQTVEVPVAKTKVTNSLVSNYRDRVGYGIHVVYPAYVDGTIDTVVIKNNSRVRVALFDGDTVAELITLNKRGSR